MSGVFFKPVFTVNLDSLAMVPGQFIVTDNGLYVDMGDERRDVLGELRESIGKAKELAEALLIAQGVKS
jgi:hypothetical protein